MDSQNPTTNSPFSIGLDPNLHPLLVDPLFPTAIQPTSLLAAPPSPLQVQPLHITADATILPVIQVSGTLNPNNILYAPLSAAITSSTALSNLAVTTPTQSITRTIYAPAPTTAISAPVQPTHNFAIQAGGIVTFNGKSDLDGNPLDLTDDAFVYAGKGFTLNGESVLPVQRDSSGKAITNSQGKLQLLDQALVVASGYLQNNVSSNNNYTNLNPPQVIATQSIVIPSFASIKQQELTNRTPIGAVTVTFNTAPASAQFPTGGTATQPKVIRITNGNLILPKDVNLSNSIIIVENGDINFSGKGNLTNVVLVANNGNINLDQIDTENSSFLASKQVNVNKKANLGGKTLLANGLGDINFSGEIKGTNSLQNLRIVSQGRITFSGKTEVRGDFRSVGTFSATGSADIYGTVASQQDIVFNGNSTFTYANTGNNDTTAPTITAKLAVDSGSSNSDKITSDRTISGKVTDASPIATLKAGFDTTPAASWANVTTSLQADGSFTFTPAQLNQIAGGNLSEGAHTLHLSATDIYGNQSSFDYSFTLDTTIAAPTLQLAVASDTGASSSDKITKINTPTITGTGEIGATIKLTEGTVVVGQTTVGTDGKWQVVTSAMTNGTHNLTATAIDLAGNISTASTPLSIVIDTVLPQLTLNAPLSTLNANTKLTGTINGTGSNIASINYAWDTSTTLIPITPNATGGFDQSLNFTGISNGAHKLTIVATDLAGNVTTSSYNVTVAIVTVDTQAPVITAQLASDTGASNSDKITFTPTVTGTITDASQITGFKASFDGINYVNILPQKQANGTFTLDKTQLTTVAGKPLVDGNYTLRLIATDAVGNASQNYDLAFTLDTTITVPANLKLAIGSDAGASASDNITSINTPTITGTGDVGATVKLTEGAVVVGQATVGTNGTWQITSSPLTNGNHSLIATATDIAGNISTASTPLNLVIDALLPQLTLTTPLTQTALKNDAKLVGNIDGTGSSLVGVSYRWDNSTTTISITPNATGGFNQSLDFTGIANGSHTLTITGTDVAGNILTTSYAVNVALDKEAPLVNLQLASDTGNNTSDKITNNPTITGKVTDVSGLSAVTVSLNPNLTNGVNITTSLQADGTFSFDKAALTQLNGGQLPDGNYQVYLQAIDNYGNATTPQTLAFQLLTQAITPTNLQLLASSDTGASNSDKITKTNQPAIQGSGKAGDTIQLFEGTTLLGQTTIGTDGTWQITSTTLADGNHNLTAKTIDLAGNISGDSSGLSINIDTVIPNLQLSQQLAGVVLTGASRLAGQVTDTNITTISYQFDGASPITLAAGTQFDTPFDFTGINDGGHNLTVTATDIAGNTVSRTYGVTVARGTLLTIALLNDTGVSNSDGITSDINVRGQVADRTRISRLEFSLDGSTNYADLTVLLQLDGTFRLLPAQLNSLAGGTLNLGTHSLNVRGVLTDGTPVATATLNFTYESANLNRPSLTLTKASDTGVIGDLVTSAPTVDLVAKAASGSSITLGTQTLVADVNGIATFTGVNLTLGGNNFTLTTTASNGEIATSNTTITRTNPDDVILTWNHIALAAIQRENTPPPSAARVLGMVHTAMYDAVNAIEQKYGVYRVDATAPTGADAIAAAAAAAAKVLNAIYPNQQAFFNAALTNSLADGATAMASAAGVALGETVAANILAWRQQDGSRNPAAFNPTTNVGDWQPDLPNYDGALLPQWGKVTTFGLTSGSQFRPAGDPSLTSAAYTAAFNETKDLGSRDSSLRTADQTQSVLFWANGGGSYTPAGHWNDIAATAASVAGKSVLDNARIFAQLNIALADAGIAAWDSKYTFNTWRPITAIRQADKDGNPLTSADPNWVPLINTPPFPEYVSGHSTFSAAAAAVLGKSFGNAFSFNSGSVTLPNVTRSFTSFDAAAAEAGQSRIYGGIHFQFSNQDGLALGKQIGDYVTSNLLVDNSLNPIQVRLTMDTAAFGMTNRDRITAQAGITGKVTLTQPNLKLQVAQAGGAVVDVTSSLDAGGNFQLDAAQLATIVGTLTDRSYQLTFKLVDAAGATVSSNNLSFILDTTAAQATLNPLTGTVSPTVHVTGTATDGNGGTSGRFKVDGGTWTSFSVQPNGSFDKVVNAQGLTAGVHQVAVEIADLAGNVTAQSVSFTVDNTNNIYASPATNPGWGRVFGTGFSLAEGNSLITQNSVAVALGGSGKRTLDFDLAATFDKSDIKSFGKDRVAVYLVDSNNQPIALDATHPGGVPLFSLSETGSEIIPGLVKFDGTHVQIDVSNVAATNGKLVIELLNQDGDTGSNVTVTNLVDSIDPDGTPGNSVSPAITPVTPGAATILDSYLATNNAQLLLSNVSVDKVTGKYTADLRVQNVGATTLSQNLAVLLTSLPTGVTVANSSGTHPAGSPYLNFNTAIQPGGLAGGAISDAVRVVINDPSLAAFSFKPVVLHGAAAALPDLSSLSVLTVKVGDKIDIPLTGELAIKTGTKLPTGAITGDSHLVFTPAPDQVGSYTFTLIAKNGSSSVSQNVTLNVVADPITTTRVTGIIADVNQAGLANVLVELAGAQATTDSSGRFTIILPDTSAGDTLKVNGQRIQGGGITYPFIAEKMGLLLGHDLYRGVNNQIDRPIYLPTIDVSTGTTVNPSASTVVSNPKLVGAQVTVAANSLFDRSGNAFAGIMSITEVPPSLTPAALPENLHPDLVVTIQPGDMVFNTAAQLTLPNQGGYLPGVEMDLWSINPNTGLFDKVGKGKVSADGTKIETIDGGIRNSSWHFFAPPVINLNLDNKYEQKKVCKTCEDKQSFKSEVSAQTGIVSDDRDLVTYQSQGTTRGVSLHYDSSRANPDKIFRIDGAITSGTFAQDTVTAKISIIANGIKQTLPGLNSGQAGGLNGGERIWTINSPQPINTAIQGDLSNLQSGVYQTELEVGVRGIRTNPNTGESRLVGTTNNQVDKVIVVNDSNSVFGGGWNVSGLQKLVINQDNSALLIDGDGSQWLFDPAIGNSFPSPASDFSKLEKLAGGRFLRTTKDGTRYEFNAQGYMTQATDRLGNITQHIYNGFGQIQAIVDPVGLTTRFNYTGNRVTTIVDVNQRTTTLAYDGQGNLVSITDPDGITKDRYGYDSNHRVTSSIDKNGREKVGTYDDFGRAKTATREDGTIVQINPIEVQGLLSQTQTTNLANPITPRALPVIPSSVYVDANGRVSRTTLDNRGEVVNRVDEIGLQTVNIRNNNYLVTSQVDGNGHSIDYQYDGQGNVIKVEEQIITAPNVSSTGNLFATNIRSILKPVEGSSDVTVTGDINNDGFADIITTTATNQFNVVLGDVQGSLARTYTISSSTNYDSNNITQLELKDVNGDGYLDLIANLPIDRPTGGGGSSRATFAAFSLAVDPVLVFINQGNGQFADATVLPFQPTSDGFVTGDFNGDGKLDILARMDIPSSQNTNTYPVVLYAGDGSGQFTEQPIYFPGIDTNSDFVGGGANIDAVDIDGDGRKEVIFNLYDRLSIFKYNSISSAWVNSTNYNTGDFFANRSKVITGDLNGDGFGDIVSSGYSQVSILLGRADGNLSSQILNPTDNDTQYLDLVKIADVNGDGKSDLFLGIQDYNQNELITKIYDLNVNGNLVQLGNTQKIPQLSEPYRLTDIADINGDGDLDLILNSIYGDSIGIIDNQSIFAQTITLTKSYTYDSKFNQLTSITDELGHQTLYDLDPTTGNVRSITKVIGAIGGTDDVTTGYTYTNKGQVDLITDALGRITDYDYDTYGNLVKVTTAEGTTDQAVEQYEYDLAGNRTATIDALGRRTKYTYNSMNMLLQSTDALGGATTYNYDKMGHQTRITDALGHVSQLTYDSRGRLSTTTDPNGGVTFDDYDNNGNLISSKDALGRTTSYQYDARNRLIKTINNTDNSFTTNTYDLNDNIIGTTDELGRKTQRFYDVRNRLSREIDALGNQTKYTYDGANELIAITDAKGHKTKYQYDDLGRRIAVIDELGQTTRTEYDKLGDVTATIDAKGNRTEYTYDALNRLVRIKDAAGSITQTVYDKVGNIISVTDPLNHTTSFAYDALDRRTSVTDALNRTSTIGYDAVGNILTTTDALNRTTSFAYDALDRQISTTDALGHSATIGYDAIGNILTTTDELGRTTSHVYDRRDREIQTIDALGNTTNLSYDAVGNVIAVKDARGNTTSFAYDGLDRLIKKTDALLHDATTTYDAVGNVIATRDELGRTTGYVYDELDRQITRTDALNHSINTGYDANDNVISTTDELGRITTYGYDVLDRLSTAIDPLFQQKSIGYDAVGNIISTTDKLGRVSNYGYDALNRKTSTTNALGQISRISYDNVGNAVASTDALGRVTNYAYDALDRLIATTDPLAQQTSVGYDFVGNIISSTDKLGQVTSYGYDLLNRKISTTDSLGLTNTRIYDRVGNVTKITDALGSQTQFVYDALDRQTRQIDALGGKTDTSYDFVGNVTTITDSVGNQTTYTYDALNRQISDTNQLGKARTFSYDAVGNQIQKIDRDGRKISYSYDALDRETSENWLNSSNALVKTFAYTYDAVGHLLTSTDPDSKYTYTYDAIDRITSVDNAGTAGVPAVKFNYGYDAVGNLLTVNDSINGVNAGVTAYTYDLLNRATRLTQSGTGISNKRVDMSYNAVDRLTSLNRFSDLTGTNAIAQTNYVYDSNQRLIQLGHKKGASTIASYDYSYDANNRLTRTVSSIDGTNDYSYDATNQLTGTDHSSQVDEAYSYDANGNRTNYGYGTGIDNWLLTDGIYNYQYDDEGNRTRRTEIATGSVTEYVWDYRNRLTSVLFKDASGIVTKTIDYAYDGNNQRIGKRIDGAVTERYVLDRNQIALVFDGAGVQTHRYLYGTRVDQVLADETPTQVLWALADNQGTVKDLIDNNGNAVSHINYDSFGRVVSQTGSSNFRYGYTGRDLDSETGLDYYRARYYDAAVGRFISEDPIGFAAGDTNIYRYVGNSPTNYNDPSGNVGNNVNQLPNVDPNCIANKPPLEPNDDCEPGQASVPLTKARLERIGKYYGVPQEAKDKPGQTPDEKIRRDKKAFDSNIGQAFERNIVRSIEADPGNIYGKISSVDPFFSPTRAALTKGAVTNSTPDLIGPLILKIRYPDQPPQLVPFPNSSIIEVKASSRASLNYAYDNYQTAGVFDRAILSPANNPLTNPAVTFINTYGTKIGRSIKTQARTFGIILYQAIAEESCSSPGSIRVGSPTLLNSDVLKSRLDPENPFTIPSRFVQFQK
jgi:RHS repeat-associated protein